MRRSAQRRVWCNGYLAGRAERRAAPGHTLWDRGSDRAVVARRSGERVPEQVRLQRPGPQPGRVRHNARRGQREKEKTATSPGRGPGGEKGARDRIGPPMRRGYLPRRLGRRPPGLGRPLLARPHPRDPRRKGSAGSAPQGMSLLLRRRSPQHARGFGRMGRRYIILMGIVRSIVWCLHSMHGHRARNHVALVVCNHAVDL